MHLSEWAGSTQTELIEHLSGSFSVGPAEYSRNWGINHIGALEAWASGTGEGITVAVLDTGIDYDHTDLDANLWVNTSEIAGDGIDNDGNGFVDDIHGWNFTSSGASSNINDVRGHGTHVAGIIAAEANGQGTVGVAPDAEIMGVKVLSDGGSGSWSGIARGIDYAVENGAKIINMSLGGGSLSTSVFEAVARAQEAGVIIVAAAGNSSGSQALYPAALAAEFDNVISVANSTQSDTIAGSSNYSIDGTTVDLAAPGSNIFSTMPDNMTGSKTGTSMAAPMVAGAAAVLWSAAPHLKYVDIIKLIESSVTALASLAKPVATNGVLNLAEAMRLLLGTELPEEPINEAPTLGMAVAVSSLAEDTVDPSTILLADLIVTDDGVGVAMLELTGGDVEAFEIRNGALYLREGVTVDFETKSSYTIEISVDDPDIGDSVEDTISYTLSIDDVDETPAPEPEPIPDGRPPDAIAGLNFWYNTALLNAGSTERLSDLSGQASDAVASKSERQAEAGDAGLRFDGDDVYRIADDTDLNRGGPYIGKTLTFTIETGVDVDSRQVLYEQGGTTRGLSVYVEAGEIVMAGWNFREQAWGVLSVSTTLETQARSTISLVFDAEAGKFSGWKDGVLFGTRVGANKLYAHSDDIGLGGVQGRTLVADGSSISTGEAYWTGALFEAAGYGRALSGEEITALHAGLNEKWFTDGDAPEPPAPNVAPVAVNDGPFEVVSGTEFSMAVADLLANDTDADGDALTLTGIVAENGGAARIDNDTFIFTADAAGQAAIVYEVADGRGGTDEGTVYFAVTALPDPDPEPTPDPVPDPEPTPNPEPPIPGPEDPAPLLVNHGIMDLGDRDKTYVFATDQDGFKGSFAVLNKNSDPTKNGLNEAAGNNTMTFSDAAGLAATDEFVLMYELALQGDRGMQVSQIDSDMLRFEVEGKRATDVAYFEGDFVVDLLSSSASGDWSL